MRVRIGAIGAIATTKIPSGINTGHGLEEVEHPILARRAGRVEP
jgi:hypothetical protein